MALDFPPRTPSQEEKLREAKRQRDEQHHRYSEILKIAGPYINAADTIISKDDAELKNKANHLMEASKIFRDNGYIVEACHHYEQAKGALRNMKTPDAEITINCYEALIFCLQTMRDKSLNGGIYANDSIIALLVETQALKGNSIGNSEEINDCYKELSKYSTYNRSMQEIDNALIGAELGLQHNVLDARSLYFCLQNAKNYCDISNNNMALLEKINACLAMIHTSPTLLQAFNKIASHYEKFSSEPSVTLLMQVQQNQSNPTFSLPPEPTATSSEPRIIGPSQFPHPEM